MSSLRGTTLSIYSALVKPWTTAHGFDLGLILVSPKAEPRSAQNKDTNIKCAIDFHRFFSLPNYQENPWRMPI